MSRSFVGIVRPTLLPHASRHQRRRESTRSCRTTTIAAAASSTDSSPQRLQTHQLLPPQLIASSKILRTASGEAVRSFALGGNRNVRQPRELVAAARAAGVNYFFAYSMARGVGIDHPSHPSLSRSLPHRQHLFLIAVCQLGFLKKV
jgi:hypothetical protein